MATFRVLAPRNALSGCYGFPGYLTLGEEGGLAVETPAPTTPVTATLSVTLAGLTVAGVGAAGPAVATQWDEAGVHWDNPLYFWDDVLAGVVTGTLTQTLVAVTVIATGTVVLVSSTGTLTQALEAVTSAGVGTVPLRGLLARTLEDLSVDATSTAFVPSFPNRRRGFLKQPIGPTHVLVH